MRQFLRMSQSLGHFLASLTYYGKFLENLSTVIKPVTVLLKKDSLWNWCTNCQEAFEKVKAQLLSSTVLTHFDLELPILLACDAYSHWAWSPNEWWQWRTSQDQSVWRLWPKLRLITHKAEKETLGISVDVHKFRYYLCVRKFVLVTDQLLLSAYQYCWHNLQSLLRTCQWRWVIKITLTERGTTKQPRIHSVLVGSNSWIRQRQNTYQGETFYTELMAKTCDGW